MNKKVSLLQFAIVEGDKTALSVKDHEFITVGVFTENVEEGLDSDDVAMSNYHVAKEKEPWKNKRIVYRCFDVELNSVLSFDSERLYSTERYL